MVMLETKSIMSSSSTLPWISWMCEICCENVNTDHVI